MASGAAAAFPRLPRRPGGNCNRPRVRVSAAAARASPRVPASGLVGVMARALAVALQRAPVAAGWRMRVAVAGLPAHPCGPPMGCQAMERAARVGGARPVVGGAVPPRCLAPLAGASSQPAAAGPAT